MNRLIHTGVRAALCMPFERKEAGGGGGGDPGPATTLDRIASTVTIKNMAEAEAAIKDISRALAQFCTKAAGEMKDSGKLSTETAAAITKLNGALDQSIERLGKLEAKYERRGDGIVVPPSVGAQFVDLADYKAGMAGQGPKRARLQVKTLLGNMETRAIVNATGQNQPLVPDMRVPGIITPQQRRLTIRDLIPVGRTSSNLVQFVSETLFTNNAGPQVGAGSPTTASENATKNESDITFELDNAPVATIAHFILASKQVLDDAAMLQSYIEGRMMYGLKLEEEDQLLNGDGAAGNINGLWFQAAAFNRANTGTRIDILRRAQTQIALQEYSTEFYVLNPVDWEEIELTKDSQGRYIIARPEVLTPPALWGAPVVPTQSISATYWLAANGSQAAQIWDREDAAVELSREDSDNFRKNMVTLLAEERLALTVYRAGALVKGQFQQGN